VSDHSIVGSSVTSTTESAIERPFHNIINNIVLAFRNNVRSCNANDKVRIPGKIANSKVRSIEVLGLLADSLGRNEMSQSGLGVLSKVINLSRTITHSLRIGHRITRIAVPSNNVLNRRSRNINDSSGNNLNLNCINLNLFEARRELRKDVRSTENKNCSLSFCLSYLSHRDSQIVIKLSLDHKTSYIALFHGAGVLTMKCPFTPTETKSGVRAAVSSATGITCHLGSGQGPSSSLGPWSRSPVILERPGLGPSRLKAASSLSASRVQ